MRPVHAGLLGNDTLLCLDEVHLAQPFAQTLRALRDRYRVPESRWSTSRWQVMEMSATPGSNAERAFHLEAEDLDPAHSPVLMRRLGARKPTALREIGGRNASRADLATGCAHAAVELLAQSHVNTVGVVVNRVETAQAVATQLADQYDVRVLLLTGRMRPFDRDDILERWANRLVTGRKPRDDGTPFAVVGTQCIEAGADFDFDGLVTECASLDALRQRFGRVDRDGELSAAGTLAPGVVVALPRELEGAVDPVYGAALAATWRWLQNVRDLDFGVRHLPDPPPGEMGALVAPHGESPVLFPAHLDSWAQTYPLPRPDPDVALWLHGIRPASTDVQIVWRADLSESLLSLAAVDDDAHDQVVDLVAACPPADPEAVAVPIGAARRWLARVTPAESGVPDVEGQDADLADYSRESSRTLPYLRWRGDKSVVCDDANRLAPGEVVVVPGDYGGLTRFSWDPSATEVVKDLGHRAQLGRRRSTLRLIPPLCKPATVPIPGDEEVDPLVVVRRWLTEHHASLVDDASRSLATSMIQSPRALRVQQIVGPRYEAVGEGESVAWHPTTGATEYFVCSAWAARPLHSGVDGDADSEPGTSSFTGIRRVPLDEHLTGCAQIAAALARNSGLPPKIVNDVRLAGLLHDLGKLDPRFQLWLHDGDEIAVAMADAPLAKSGLPRADNKRRELARAKSCYPKGARHELLSASLLEANEQPLGTATDRELVLHLIESHHGFARPFAPVIPDRSPPPVRETVMGSPVAGSAGHDRDRLDSGMPERFWRLVDAYGWYGLSWLEAILRLADHAQSAIEQMDGASAS
jgi:CRISPR-associated endonuclease/helicase Cas3